MRLIQALLFILMAFTFSANAIDQELASKLKNDLEFDTQRRNDFKNQSKNKKVYEKERDKGLSLFLEEQEKWDVTREKGIAEQRALRLKDKKMEDDGPEYKQDLKEKQQYEKTQELARRRHVDTQREVNQFFKDKVIVTEEEELDIYDVRPRYDIRKRGQNKWVTRGGSARPGSSGGGGYSGGSGASPSPGSSSFDYPPPINEYVPTDSFEEIPPPPPLMPYEGGYGNPGDFPLNGNAPDFGAPQPNMGYPPPPPPDGGWDF